MQDDVQWLKAVGDRFRRETLERREKMPERILAAQIAIWRKAIGDDFKPMLTSRETALQIARTSDGVLRTIAVDVLASHWKIGRDKEFLEVLEKMFADSSDNEGRALAIHVIGRLFKGIADNDWTRKFCTIALDEQQEMTIRRAAYLSLCIMTQRPRRLRFPSKGEGAEVRRPNFPEDADWQFVAGLLDGQAIQPPDPNWVFEIRTSAWEAASLSASDSPIAKSIVAGHVTINEDTASALIREFPDWAAYSIRAEVRLREGKAELAISDATEAIFRNADASEPLLTRAFARSGIGEIDLANEDLEAYEALVGKATDRFR